MDKAIDDLPEYYAKDREAWRKWLAKNHLKYNGVWLIYYKKGSGKTRVDYKDAVKEALCFGWIDTTYRPIDDEKYKQLFTPRKPKGTWSGLNKTYVTELIKESLMTPAGLEMIELAKKNGSWEKLDHVEAEIRPPDLKAALAKNKTATVYFEGLSKTNRFYILHWLNSAKKEETRMARIKEIMEALKQKKMPERFIRIRKK